MGAKVIDEICFQKYVSIDLNVWLYTFCIYFCENIFVCGLCMYVCVRVHVRLSMCVCVCVCVCVCMVLFLCIVFFVHACVSSCFSFILLAPSFQPS